MLVELTDTEILDWIEASSKKYLLSPPERHEDSWFVYERGDTYTAQGKTLRECVNNAVSHIITEELHKVGKNNG